jgi:uncharacterized protein (DUF1810 family)
MTDAYNLQRFIDAQTSVYDEVLQELGQGQKSSHWIWFIFPQIHGLGHSYMSRKFAVSSLQEAEAYILHPILGPRLRECTRLVLDVEGKTIQQILGPPDDLKFRSSITLFARATAENKIFEDALQKYFEGIGDNQTIEMLR